jgi:hypothetical protein
MLMHRNILFTKDKKTTHTHPKRNKEKTNKKTITTKQTLIC